MVMEKKMKAQTVLTVGERARFDNLDYIHNNINRWVRRGLTIRLWNIVESEVDSTVSLLRDIVKTDIHR